MRYLLLFIIVFFYGCSYRSADEIDRQLEKKDHTYIYDIKLDNIIESLDEERSALDKFPFISDTLKHDHKGRFSSEFYKQHKINIASSSLDKVDLWALENNPKLLDIIYTKPIWIEDYKNISDDLFVNICYSYNLSNEQQKILKKWIRKGGILWIENGIYTTGNELDIHKRLPKKQHFFDFNVTSSRYVLGDKSTVLFEDLQTSPYFKNINSLQLNLNRATQTFFIIEGEYLIGDKFGNTLLSSAPFGNGKIISMLPFEFYDAYRDGELLRWDILQILESTLLSNQSKVKKTFNIESNGVKTVDQLGGCIQIFISTNWGDSLKRMEDAREYPMARIEKKGSYYIGRVGMYSSKREAEKDLRELRKKYSGAFLGSCTMKVEFEEE